MMYKSRSASSLVIVISFLAAVVLVSWHGRNNRLYTAGTSIITVDSPEKAYFAWEEKKVRGRILLLFGSYPHLTRSSDYEGGLHLTSSNVIEFSVLNNLIRKIYYIIPDDSWEDMVQNTMVQKGIIGSLRRISCMERGMYLYNLLGIPVIATTPTSLPIPSEKVLVYIDHQLFDEVKVRDILSNKGIASDIVISYKAN